MLARLRRDESVEAPLSSSCPTSFDFESAMRAQRRLSASVSNRIAPVGISVQGAATLCFSEDGKAFRGVVASQDGYNYSVTGARTPRRKIPDKEVDQEQSEDLAKEGEPEGIPFDIKVKDCDCPLTPSNIRRAPVTRGNTCVIACPSISFSSDSTYRGQRAKLVAHESMGSVFDGQDVHVYTGDISIQVATFEKPHHWVL